MRCRTGQRLENWKLLRVLGLPNFFRSTTRLTQHHLQHGTREADRHALAVNGGPAKMIVAKSQLQIRVSGQSQTAIWISITIAMPIIIRFSVRLTKPSGTFELPPTQAHFSSRLSM